MMLNVACYCIEESLYFNIISTHVDVFIPPWQQFKNLVPDEIGLLPAQSPKVT